MHSTTASPLPMSLHVLEAATNGTAIRQQHILGELFVVATVNQFTWNREKPECRDVCAYAGAQRIDPELARVLTLCNRLTQAA